MTFKETPPPGGHPLTHEPVPTVGRKDDAGKLDWTLLPPQATVAVTAIDLWGSRDLVQAIAAAAAQRPLEAFTATLAAGVGPDVLEGVVKVLAYGAEKYGRDNWRLVPDGPRRYCAAACRHLRAANVAWTDPESGLPHLDHARASLMMAYERMLDE